MGQIIQTKAQFGNKTSRGEVHLKSDSILFSGNIRLKIPFIDISSVQAKTGRLEITFPEGSSGI